MSTGFIAVIVFVLIESMVRMIDSICDVVILLA
jgi:hypothetical protein